MLKGKSMRAYSMNFRFALLGKQRVDPVHKKMAKAFISSRTFRITEDGNSLFVGVKRPQETVQQQKPW